MLKESFLGVDIGLAGQADGATVTKSGLALLRSL
jgi:hypothetical protein